MFSVRFRSKRGSLGVHRGPPLRCAAAELVAERGLGNLCGDVGRRWALKSDSVALGLRSGSSTSFVVLTGATTLLQIQF